MNLNVMYELTTDRGVIRFQNCANEGEERKTRVTSETLNRICE